MADILIVDDNPGFRRALKDILIYEIPSLHVEEAGNGKELLRLMETGRPDLIFMDIGLPGENGLKLTKRVKKMAPEISVLVITNHDSDEYRESAYAAGADLFLSKKASTPTDLADAVKVRIDKGP